MKKIVYLITLLILLFGCSDVKVELEEEIEPIKKAIAVLSPMNNSGVSGIIHFTDQNGVIKVVASVKGLEIGNHGFHIHNYGDLSDENGLSTGKIYNPEISTTVDENMDALELGRLGNIYAVDNETARFNQDIFSLSIARENPILGRAIVIHKMEDDLSDAECGNAGEIVAAGVIGIENKN